MLLRLRTIQESHLSFVLERILILWEWAQSILVHHILALCTSVLVNRPLTVHTGASWIKRRPVSHSCVIHMLILVWISFIHVLEINALSITLLHWFRCSMFVELSDLASWFARVAGWHTVKTSVSNNNLRLGGVKTSVSGFWGCWESSTRPTDCIHSTKASILYPLYMLVLLS